MRDKPSSKQFRRRNPYDRPIIYDREMFIEICRSLLLGQDLKAICTKPPMPIGPVFLGWIQDHKEAREIDRSMQNFRSDRALANKLGTPLPLGINEWEEQVRANIQCGWPADYLDRGYMPPDWSKVFPAIGDPPASSAKDMQAYNDLLTLFTQMLEPRNLVELIWTKEATDATWEGKQDHQDENGLIRITQLATGQELGRVFAAGFNCCRSTQLAQSRLIKRRDNALRELARSRKGLGAKSRRLPDQFLDEQVLAQRYLEQVRVGPENDAVAPEAKEAAAPLAPGPAAAAEAAAEATAPRSRPLAPSEKPAHAPPQLASGDNPAQAAPLVAPSDQAGKAAPQLAPADETTQVASSTGEAVSLPAAVNEAARVAPPTASSGAAVAAAVPLTARVNEAARVEPPIGLPPLAPSDKGVKAPPPDGPHKWAA
jgi:hypothetical protein